MRRFFPLLLALVVLALPAESQKRKRGRKSKPVTTERTIESVRRDKKANERELRDTDRKLAENRRSMALRVDSLEAMRMRGASMQSDISRMAAAIDSTDRAIAAMDDSIASLEARTERLREAFRKSLRSMQGERTTSSHIEFIFSAANFRQAVQRMRYLRQFGIWQKARTDELRKAANEVALQRARLDTMRAERTTAMARLQTARTRLADQEQQCRLMLSDLKKRSSDLQAVLRDKEKRSRQLDQELDRLIAAEQARMERERKRQEELERTRQAESKRKAGAKGQSKPAPTPPPQGSAPKQAPLTSMAEADRKLTGSFTDNKGRLLFPVSGPYRIVRGFGRQKHPDMQHVITENNGIDIETNAGANARAVFAGRVASILQVQGYNYIVMVRHGNYLTVYSGLEKPVVTMGQEVKAGQTLAPVMSDHDRGGRGVLHFELRYNSRKYNPLEWIK